LSLDAGTGTLDQGAGVQTQDIDLQSFGIITDGGALGFLLKNNGTKYVDFPIGTSLQVLRVNAGGTDLEYATPASAEFFGPWTALHDAGGFNLDNIGALISNGTNPAQASTIRLANGERIAWRDSTNNFDVTIALSGNLFSFGRGIDTQGNESFEFNLRETIKIQFDEGGPFPTTGFVQFANNGNSITWRNAANTADILLKVDASDNFLFGSSIDLAGFNLRNFGFLESNSANPATSAQIRLGTADDLAWRNVANSGNLLLGLDGADGLEFAGDKIATLLATQTLNLKTLTNFQFLESANSPVAQAGAIRLGQNELITWRNIANNFDIAMSVISDQFFFDAPINANANEIVNFTFLESNATNPASIGAIRLGINEEINWRNVANTADIGIRLQNDVFTIGAGFIMSGNIDMQEQVLDEANLRRTISIEFEDPDPAVVGNIRFGNNSSGIQWRNFANTADIKVTINTSDAFEINTNFDLKAFFMDIGEIATPANPAANIGRLYVKDDATVTKLFFRDSAGTETDLLAVGGGETNTASNVGTGVGVFDVKNGVDLEFNSLIGGTGIDIADTVQDLTISIDSTVAVHSENLSVFAATTSLQLSGVISDTTGSGVLVFNDAPTISNPTISDFSLAQHDHRDAIRGGQLTNTALVSGVFGAITGLGAQSQTLDMNSNIVDNFLLLVSNAAFPAQGGRIRLGQNNEINWRNAANTADFGIEGNGSDELEVSASFDLLGNNLRNFGFIQREGTPISTSGAIRMRTNDAIRWRNTGDTLDNSISFGGVALIFSNAGIDMQEGIINEATISNTILLNFEDPNPATTGNIRFGNNSSGIQWRNFADNANIKVTINASDAFEIGTDVDIGTNFLDIGEISTPANPAVNVGRTYVKDVTGTTTLFFRDNAGVETNLLTVGGGADTAIFAANYEGATSSLDRMFVMSGSALPVATTNELDVQSVVAKASTFDTLRITVFTNARGTASTFKSRINGVDGNLSITIGAGLTGAFSDLINNDSVTAGDFINYIINLGGGGGSIGVRGAGLVITL